MNHIVNYDMTKVYHTGIQHYAENVTRGTRGVVLPVWVGCYQEPAFLKHVTSENSFESFSDMEFDHNRFLAKQML